MSEYLIVDSSFIMSSLLPDENGTEHDLASYSIYVPAIFYLECTNVVNMAFKRKRINNLDFEQYLQVLSNLPFNVDKFSATPESLHLISQLCQKFDLTSYDACYLELAIRLGAKLGTYDQQLIAACKKNNIITL
jgi:predicted nucleic acid-binding protein